jgi:hypothetical protein
MRRSGAPRRKRVRDDSSLKDYEPLPPRDPAIVAAEDQEIQRRRDAFPLH